MSMASTSGVRSSEGLEVVDRRSLDSQRVCTADKSSFKS